MMVVPAPVDANVPAPGPAALAEHRFEHGGSVWVARGAGSGDLGAGELGPAHLDAVHFHRDGETRPAFEALLARGRFEHLHPAELIALLEGATPIPPA